MSRTFTLGEPFERFIDEQLRSGRYASEDDVIRAALSLLDDRMPGHALSVDDIRRSIEDGRVHGRTRSETEVFATLEAAIRARTE